MGAGCTAGIGVVRYMYTNVLKKEFSGFGLRMLAVTVVINVIQIAVQIFLILANIGYASDASSGRDMNFANVSVMIAMYAIGYPCAFLILKDVDKRTIIKHKMKPPQFFLAFLMTYALMIAGNLIGLVFTSGIGFLKGSPVNDSLSDLMNSINMVVILVFVVIAAPIFEELLFRKFLCDRVVKYGQGTAIILSGLMFGLFHGNFQQFFYAFFIGCFFAFIYVKTGDIRYTITLHIIVNFIGGVVSSLLLSHVDFENLTASSLIIMAIYMLIVYGIAIAGAVLFLLNRSKLKSDAGEIMIEKSQRNNVVFLNAGMILYGVVYLIMMIVQALM